MSEAVRLAALVRHPDFQLRLRWTSLPLWVAIWAAACVGTFAAILLLDQWLALAAQRWFRPSRLAYLLIRWPEALAALTVTATAVLGLWRCAAGRLRGVWNTLFLAGIGVCVALALKTEFKLLFGRLEPTAWFRHYDPPLRTFHIFYDGSFPSGHMAVLGVLTAFAWAYGWPLRLAWLLGCAAVGGAMMVVGAHFFTDLVTGMLLGVTIGAICRRAAPG